MVWCRGRYGGRAWLAALWLLGGVGWAQSLPIQVSATHPGAVWARQAGSGDPYRKVSTQVPAVLDTRPGERWDIRVTGRANWWSDWMGERQGCTGPALITVRQERVPAWQRLRWAAAGGLSVSLLGLFGWRRRTARRLAASEQRARVAESGTGLPVQIADYRILGLIGEGGMAHVYHGQDRHGRDLAIKVPKTVDERFQRECLIATTLESPHIVRAYDYCTEKSPGRPAYLAQERLLGETLQERIGRGALPLEEVDRWMGQLLAGLEVAHREGVLHRDLKPENLFLDRSGSTEVLKILDFGVARADDALLVTVSGAMLGTPLYSSPEQNRSDRLDQRSDLYAVGLIAFEMLTGRRLWNASNRYELLKLHQAGLQQPVSHWRPQLPPAWDQVVAALLHTDPELRPGSVAEVRQRWGHGRI